MGEEGAPGIQSLRERDRVGEVGVAGVRLVAERVDDEDVEILEHGVGLGRQVGKVGKVGGAAEAVADDGLAAVQDGHVEEAGAEEVERLAGGGKRVEGDAGAGWVAVFGTEGVVEDAAEGGGGFGVGVEGDAGGGAEGKGAEVIHAEGVVGVSVGVEHGVNTGDALTEGLGVEVGAGVDQNRARRVGLAFEVGGPLKAQRGAGAAVVGLGVGRAGGRKRGKADGAAAAEGRHAHRGAAAEKGEVRLHAGRLTNDAGAAAGSAEARPAAAWPSGSAWGSGSGALLGRAGKGLGDFKECQAQLKDGAIDEALFGMREISLCLAAQDAEHVNTLAGAEQVDLGLLAFLGAAAKLQDGLHVNGLDDPFKAHGGRVIHTGIGSADGCVEAVGSGFVSEARLLHLLGCGRGGQIRVGDTRVWIRLGAGFRRGFFELGSGRRVRRHGDRAGDRRWRGVRLPFRFGRGGRRGLGNGVAVFGGGRVGVWPRFAFGVELATVGDHEGERLVRHGCRLVSRAMLVGCVFPGRLRRRSLLCSGYAEGQAGGCGSAAGLSVGSSVMKSFTAGLSFERFAADVAEGEGALGPIEGNAGDGSQLADGFLWSGREEKGSAGRRGVPFMRKDEAGKGAVQVASRVDALDDLLAEIAAFAEVQRAGLLAGGGGLLRKLALADVLPKAGYTL